MSKNEIKKRIMQFEPDDLPDATPADFYTPHDREAIGGGDIQTGTDIVWECIEEVICNK